MIFQTKKIYTDVVTEIQRYTMVIYRDDGENESQMRYKMPILLTSRSYYHPEDYETMRRVVLP